MIKSLLVCICIAAIALPLTGQSYAFGIKGGPSLGSQKWNGFNGREPLLRYHGLLFIESHNEESQSSLFAQTGYHIRGSALRTFAYYDEFIMQNVPARTSNMEFKNISLAVGAKRKHDLGISKAYYLFGLRGEYTVDTEMQGFMRIYEGLENKFLFGVIAGGGIEFPFSRFISGIFEVTVSPDLSKQIYLFPQDTGFTDQNGNPIILREQSISNVSFEVTLGLRFLREIIYYD
jgi:hypothetical protein